MLKEGKLRSRLGDFNRRSLKGKEEKLKRLKGRKRNTKEDSKLSLRKKPQENVLMKRDKNNNKHSS